MIHVPITNAHEETSRVGAWFFASLLGTFAIGAGLGIFASTEYEMRAPALGEGLRSQLSAIGAIGELGSAQVLPLESAGVTALNPGDANATNETSGGIQSESALPPLESAPLIITNDFIPTRTELEVDVVTQQIVVDRLTQEMTQIKNASLALITEFDQNCGNWNDACALPYSDTLEIHNRRYERLTKNRNSEMLVLLRYETLLTETP